MSEQTSVPANKYKHLTAVVPVYNERNTVGEVVRRLRALDLPEGMDLEVIIVDDGSTDGTDKVLATVEDSTVRVVRHAVNQGKGAALRSGIEAARGQLILTLDADLEYSPDELPRLLRPILEGRATVVFGSRFHPDREVMSLVRLLGGRGVSLVTDVLFNTTLRDVKTGYRLYDADVLRSITIENDGFAGESEITAKLLRNKHRIFEVAVTYRQPEGDNGQKFTSRDNLQALAAIVKYRFAKVS